ncbi:SurA N-terminal domain-containing protein [Helicobacter muridarum]|nr:SurA N-terminal domain-containing protein [Helicobacter muridarum]STQ86793.1 putative peptidyl-prolyl cis-trans isomerase D [Helicobacter muridarum]
MLEWMQKHRKYLIATVWISALALIFAMLVEWGGGGFSAGSSDTIAKVGNLNVDRSEYLRAYNYLKNLYQISDDSEAQIFGIDDEAFRQTVRTKLLELVADDIGVTVTQDEIADSLMSIPAFQVNNRFDKNQYFDFLSRSGQKAEFFEKLLGKEILNEKIQNLPLFSPSTLELNTFLSANNISDDIYIKILKRSELLKNENFDISDSSIEDFWNQNRGNYYKPSIYKIAYVAIKPSMIDIDTKNLRQFFEDNKTKYADNAFDENDESLLNDYKIEQAKIYAQFASTFIDNYLDSNPNSQDMDKIVDNNSFSVLNLESINKLRESFISGAQMEKGMIPIRYAELAEDNKNVYIQLLNNLAMSNTNKHKTSKTSNMDIIEGDNIIIVPHFITKVGRIPLEFSEVKDRVKNDLLEHQMQTKFNDIAQLKLNEIIQNNSNISSMQHLGFVSLADSTQQNQNSIIPARNNIKVHSLKDFELKNAIAQIFRNNNKQGLIFLNDEKTLLYVINQQNMPKLDELFNASNNAIDEITQYKTRDMRNALFEYATSKYRIIDYRRKD